MTGSIVPAQRSRVTALSPPTALLDQLEQDVRAGLLRPGQKWLPPKYFYDGRGSELFEQITQLDEYYPTRAETEILERVAEEIVASIGPQAVVELGSGSSRKTRLLLQAMHAAGTGRVYVPLDVSVDALESAATALTADHAWLHVDGFVGDFHTDLHRIPHPDGRWLVTFLGSTIGNFPVDRRIDLLREVRRMLRDEDRFLVGADLVKGRDVLEAAYDDAAGVTAAFNRNMLVFVNRIAGSDFEPADFDHRARWNAHDACVEMHLVARRDLEVTFPTLPATVAFAAGESLLTEVSCKFTRSSLADQLAAADLAIERWETDAGERFALALVAPA